MAITNSSPVTGPPLPGQSAQLQLHDIHVPEQISNLPLAPGWWLLLTIIIISAVWFYKRFKKNKQVNASKNQALLMLENNPTLDAKACITLLKWAAMQYFSRQQLAKLYGEGLQDFLVKQLPDKYQQNFTSLIKPAFKEQYQAEPTAVTDINGDIAADCQQATKLWLSHALPIKKPSAMKKQEELSA